MRKATRVGVTFILAIGLSGCITADFKEPISDFTSSMSTANAAIGTYFTEMNNFEREVYLETALHDPKIKIGVINEQGQTTGLTPIFRPESIKARMDALSLLSAYGGRLAALAGSDTPTRFNAGSKVLGENLAGLAGTFQKLANGGETSAGKYTGPVSTIVGIFGEMVLEGQRDQAITRAVNDGAPAVEAILGQLEIDLAQVISPLQETGTLQSLQGAVEYYNNNRAQMSFDERRAMLARIDTFAARYQAASTAQPAEAVDGIRDAHAALVKYANSSRKPQDLASLVSALETFNNRLKPVVESLKKLEEIDDA